MLTSRRIYRGAIAAALVLFLAATVGPPLLHRYGRSMRSTTPSQGRLQQIGLALLIYRQDHPGKYPDTLVELARSPGVPADQYAFVPDDDDVRRSDPRSAYIYLGRGMAGRTVSPTDVVAYEPLAYNDGLGTSILLDDGSIV